MLALRSSLWLIFTVAAIFTVNGVYSAGIPRPSYHQGFARSAGESAYSQQWKGLIGAWVPALGPTGDTLLDWSGFKNDGTLTLMDPATDWVISGNPRLPSYALDFDGTNDLVNMGDVNLWDGLTTASWVLWFRPTTTDDDRVVLGKWATSSSTTFFFNFTTGAESGDIWIAPSATADLTVVHANIGTGVFIQNQWHHAVVVFDGNGSSDTDKLKLYVDSVEITFSGFPGTEPLPTALFGSTTDFQIGANVDTSDFFTGQIAEVRAYNRALRPGEIAQDYAISLATFQRRFTAVARVPAAVPVSWGTPAWASGSFWGAPVWGTITW